MDPLRDVLEASPDAVLIVDREGMIRQANRNVEGLLGYPPPELEGQTVENLLLEEDRSDHVRFRREYMESPEPRPMGRELDLYALREDGSSVPVEISLGPIERSGDLLVVVTITDIAKRKERERELRRKNDRLEAFARTVSHDLRNPINVAQARLEMARAECDSEHLDDVASALRRSQDLIDDLLTLAREEERAVEVEPVDLATVAEQCWGAIETAEATLVAEAERTVRADDTRLRQLLENLFGNAVEHGGEDVTVRVGDLADGFYVEDDGPGIPADDREDVFEAGYSTARDGTGFGLDIVERTADAHGWEVDVTEGDGGGARFEILGVRSIE